MSDDARRSRPPHAGVAARAVNVSKVYGSGEAEVRALDDISVEFRTARFTAIMGPSGSGKSTLLHCLAGLDRVTSGQIFLGDIEISRAQREAAHAHPPRPHRVRLPGVQPDPDAQRARRTSRCRWRSPATSPTRRGSHQIVADRPPRRPAQAPPDRALRWSAAAGRGRRARCLAGPRSMFADEPTGNLDSRAGAEILTFMRKAVDDLGQTIVMVTHDPIAAGLRRPGRVPRRRQDRRRDARARRPTACSTG